MKYLFGPVNSRRLGLSQGIDLLPGNICNFNCIYCEVGKTQLQSNERREYTPTREIIAEIDDLLKDADRLDALDVFTITATGEPTLHTGLGSIIKHIKEQAQKPVCILTNGSLCYLPEVRRDLCLADIVIPSLDSALPESYRKVNRPVHDLTIEQIIEGLAAFRAEYSGQIWLEILLVKNFNDSEADIVALKDAAEKIRPDRIQLNTVARPPLESFAKGLTQDELTAIAEHFGDKAEIIASFTKRATKHLRPPQEAEIIELLRRRPCTTDDICTALRLAPKEGEPIIDSLARDGKIIERNYAGKIFWTIPY